MKLSKPKNFCVGGPEGKSHPSRVRAAKLNTPVDGNQREVRFTFHGFSVVHEDLTNEVVPTLFVP
jgi:hypothetical protein